MAVIIRMNHTEIDRLLHAPGQPVDRHIRGIMRTTDRLAKRNCPVDTGMLRRSISYQVDRRSRGLRGRCWFDWEYGLYVELGTGIYVGNQPIRPKSGKYLVFIPGRNFRAAWTKRGKPQARSKRGLWFARQVKGQPPQPFLVPAFVAACAEHGYPVTVFRDPGTSPRL